MVPPTFLAISKAVSKAVIDVLEKSVGTNIFFIVFKFISVNPSVVKLEYLAYIKKAICTQL
jgi:hypothetical protein